MQDGGPSSVGVTWCEGRKITRLLLPEHPLSRAAAGGSTAHAAM
jgi:hypothetical protein